MGNQNINPSSSGNGNPSTIKDTSGKEIKRKCIIFIIPPGYQINKMIDGFPEEFPYRYISIGQLIRNEINKKTKYSKIILQALEKNKKISKQLLGSLLRTVALRGNFMIRYSVLDNDELTVWREFMNNVDIDMIAIIKSNQTEMQQLDNLQTKKQQINQRLSSFYKDIQNVKISFKAKSIREFSQAEDIPSQIMSFVRKNSL